MARIVIAGSSEQSRSQISRLLASSGYPIFRCCTNAGELRRALNETEDGVLILAGQMPDCSPDELALDYGERVQILLIAKPAVLEACEAQDIFRLAMPTSSHAVLGSVEMLTQLHTMQLPRRAQNDRTLIEQAKRLLMQREHLSEPEAHRCLQQRAMREHRKMTEVAEALLRNE